MLKHKNLESLKLYLDTPSLKENYAKLIKYTKNEKKDTDSDDDFQDPSAPPSKTKETKQKKKSKPTATVSVPTESNNDDTNDNELVLAEQKTETNTESKSVQNYSQMLKTNPIGMFVAANVSHCTINKKNAKIKRKYLKLHKGKMQNKKKLKVMKTKIYLLFTMYSNCLSILLLLMLQN